ncbi:MAG: DNA mismatch repair protein MutS, partial [Deltaproteobacteria bacterium]
MAGVEVERRPGGRPSALIAQYLRIKGQHREAILLFRLGDFYEMFFEDAETAARVLDLTLTARNRGDPDEVPLCGFPAHAAQPYVARLLAAGHPVAICEQSEARGRGLLEREVVRVVTPGTILEEESLDPAAPSLLAALAADGDRYGLAAIDFATGAFRATEVAGWAAAREELERLGPRELLLAPGLPEDITAACRTGRPWATALLPEPAALAEALPPLAQRAAGGALAYVDAVYRRRPAHLRPPEPYALAGFLRLDGATRRNLELLETLAGERRGGLLWVLDQTGTPMGARRLREWLLYPLVEPAAIGRRLDAVEELVDAVELRAALGAGLAGIGDLER